MATRQCAGCGARMSPRWPRKQVDGVMLCPSCVQNGRHVQTTAAGWSGEDVIRHELGRQKVHTVDGQHEVCPEHLRIRRAQDDFATGLSAQVGLPHSYANPSVSPPHEGRCEDCTRAGRGTEMPWDKPPGGGFRPAPLQDQTLVPHGWQNRPHRPGIHSFEEVPPMIRSMNVRVATVVRPGNPLRIRTTSRIRVQAHDSGDGETIFHCPFCGSGQVIARSDGTVECEFCSTAFTVQVQPQMPAFPQTIDGVPVDVPGMPAGGQNANVPPGATPGDPMDPDGDPGAVSGPPGADAPPDADADGDDDSGDDDKPAFLKGSLLLRTAAGDRLTTAQYMRHLAITHARHRSTVLAQIRDENGRA